VSAARVSAVALLLAVAAYLLSFFHRVAPAAIAGDLQAAFAIDGTQLGALAATYFYVYTLMQVPTGVLADVLGPRRILFWGGCISAAGSALFGLAPSFELAFLGRTLVGLGVSVAFIAMLKLIALGFEERRFASLVGMAMLAGNLGAVAAGAPLSWLAQSVGWRPVFLGIGALSLVIALLSRVWIPDRPLAHADRTHWLGGLLVVVRNRATWPAFFANAGLAGAFLSFAGLWAAPFLQQVHGMSRAVAANHVSVWFIGFAVGAAVMGRISDALGRRKTVMLIVSGAHALGWVIWLLSAPLPPAATYALCAAMGLASAGFTLSWACAKEVNPPELAGMATGVANVGVFLGAALLQPLTGWLLELGWEGVMDGGARVYSPQAWQPALKLMAGAAIFGWLAILFVRETHCRNIWKGNQ
jgi:predicted MFS family arabinose efflux permease